jgi:cysteine desulfurase/selenocysteine lyase
MNLSLSASSKIKEQFPLLVQNPLIYLDSAATTLKPEVVCNAEKEFYEQDYATVNRSLYPRAQKSTADYHAARMLLQKKINASSTQGIIFTKGATDSLNQVAQFLTQLLQPDDAILLSVLEHHANYLPYRALEKKKQIQLRNLPILQDGLVDFEALKKMDLRGVKALAIAHVSNVTGVEQDLVLLGQFCRERGIIFIVDAAQGIAHYDLDVIKSSIDFLAFSSHKMYGPTGLGVLYIADHLVDQLEPLVFGGDMILDIGEDLIYQNAPLKFEAGTPPIAQVISLKRALEWQQTQAFTEAKEHMQALHDAYCYAFKEVGELRVLSSSNSKTILTIASDHVHPMDIAVLLGQKGIEVRSGSLCALPALNFFGVNAFLRFSFGVYNTTEEVDAVIHHFKSIYQKLR